MSASVDVNALKNLSDGCLFGNTTLPGVQVPVCYAASDVAIHQQEEPVGRNNAGLRISASPGLDYRTRILFTTELLFTAAAEIDQNVVLHSSSKAQIVAYYLNSRLGENKDKNPGDWVLKYSSGFGG